MSQLVRLEGKHSTQNAHCALMRSGRAILLHPTALKQKRNLHSSNVDLRGCVKGETPISEVLPCKEFVQQLCKDDRDD